MHIQHISSFAVITPDPVVSRRLYVDALGLPLQAADGDDYVHSEAIGGAKHFGVWPLAQAAKACFGRPEWPSDRPVPQAMPVNPLTITMVATAMECGMMPTRSGGAA